MTVMVMLEIMEMMMVVVMRVCVWWCALKFQETTDTDTDTRTEVTTTAEWL